MGTRVRALARKATTPMSETAAANEAPYKIARRDGQWVVVNNANMVKSKFAQDRDKAVKFMRALYANVPGATKKADNTPWSGKAPKPQAAATMIEGEERDPKDMISGIDAALDAAQMLIQANDPSDLPGWAAQVCSLVMVAGSEVDDVMEVMDIPDPDDVETAASYDEVFGTAIETYLQRAKDFPPAKRDELAKKGHALPDGSFPIETVSDLSNAIQAFGRADDKAKAKSHIVRRAKALGAADKLPNGWA